jgi:hypothetical protein
MREFHTKTKPPKEPIVFTLDGREMEFTAPGWAPIVLMKAEEPMDTTRGYLDWLGAGMSDEDGQHILDRLLDPKDDFDLEDITAVILGLIEEASGRPIEPPTDSSESPEATDSTDGRQLAMSTPNSSTPDV